MAIKNKIYICANINLLHQRERGRGIIKMGLTKRDDTEKRLLSFKAHDELTIPEFDKF